MAWGLGDGEVLFPTRGTDLAPLQHLLRVACVGVDLGISGARQLARLSAANRPAAGTSCQSAADGRQYRDARHLPDRDQGRFYLARFPFQFPLFLSGVTFSHHYLPPFLARRFFKGIRREKTLLVGSPARAAQLRNWLRQKSEIGLHTAGLISQETFQQAGDLPILDQFGHFDRIVHECGATQVILLEFPRTNSARVIIDTCDRLGERLIILSDLEETLRHPVVHFEDGGFRFMALREEPLENPLNRFVKRAIDLIVSGFVLAVVFSVVAIIIWITQRLQSPGPLFHKQVRAGIQNRRFTIYKFRTMRPGDEQIAHQASGRDDRVYPLGRFFRKFSIDEIPQFWNVLRGEMSIVGPRPHLLEHNAEFAKIMAGHHVRAFVKPGITELAQVRGFRGEARDNSDIQNRVACDLK